MTMFNRGENKHASPRRAKTAEAIEENTDDEIDHIVAIFRSYGIAVESSAIVEARKSMLFAASRRPADAVAALRRPVLRAASDRAEAAITGAHRKKGRP
jgi:hypothetical protein